MNGRRMKAREIALLAIAAMERKDSDAMLECIDHARGTARGTIIGAKLNDAVAAADDALIFSCYGRELNARRMLHAIIEIN
jgi:hypothetical protein